MSALPDRERASHVPVVHALPDPPGHLPPGTRIAGRYRVDDVIGRGGMATVYRGHDELLLRDVAIKVRASQPGQPAPPLQEEQISSRLHHSNIVSIFDAGQIPEDEPGGGSAFIVMEHVYGTTALDIAPAHWAEALDIVRQVASGLSAAHELGFVHCDVTPGNVLIDRNGRALLADFGVAVEADSEAEDYVHGSPSYLAPERVQGANATARVDVYGLGGVFAYLLTGKHPQSDIPLELPDSCPEAVREIIHRARSRNPNDRYADARRLAAALDEAPELISVGDGSRAQLDADAITRHVPVAREAAPAPAGAIIREEPSGRDASPDPVIETARPVPERAHGRSVVRAAALVAIALAVVLGLVIANATFTGTTPSTIDPPGANAAVEMPDVSGMTFAAAIEQLSEREIGVSRVDVVYGPGPLNQVVAQEPPAGQQLTGEEVVTLVVRTGR
ncbi:MAG TPA: protein kinase [Thermomicrobiales bacterium]|nr:protein kinase [Thermomicrobiales bacterium]